MVGLRLGMHFLASALRFLEPRVDDDFVDRLHYLYTSTAVLMFAVIVSAKQYGWCIGTYFLPFNDLIPHRLDDRERKQIGYYQWVPFMLAIAALMFHVPSSVWRMLAGQSGLNASLALQMACEDHNVDPLVRNKTIDVLARHIDDAIAYQRDHGARKKSIYLFAVVRLGKFYGAYVSTVYVFIKVLHLCNVVVQFLVLNAFLDTSDYPFFGAHVVYDLLMVSACPSVVFLVSAVCCMPSELSASYRPPPLQGREWRDSGKFPRVTLCDFEIRVLGNVHRHTVQCVLVINMLTEKIFIFLWLWFSLLSLITFLNLFFWICALGSVHCRRAFVSKHLSMESEQIERFTDRFLRPDGVFILQMVASHAGNLTCAKLTEALWLIFLRRSGRPLVEEKAESSEHGDWDSTDGGTGRKSPPLRKESWKEGSLPPPMPLLPARTHFV